MIKRLLLTLTATLACLATTQAQIAVGPTGSGVLALDSAPADASQFATLSVAGDGNTYTTIPAVDTGIQALDQSAIATVLPTSATVPPSTSVLGFRYNTALQVIQSRPTGDGAILLKATLRNDTGGSVSSLLVNYDFATQSPAASVGDLPAHIVYFSLTGAPNSWTRVDALSDGNEGSGSRTATLAVGSWAANSTMYIVWVDDNANGITDPSYTIDNLSFTPGTATFASISFPTNNATFPQGASITVSAAAALPKGVASVSFFDGATLIATDTTAPFSISWTTASLGNHTLSAVASDGQGGSTASTNIVVIHVVPNTPPVISVVTNDLAVSAELVGKILTYTAVATDDGGVTNVEFRVDGVHRWNDTTSPYTFAWCDLTTGNHTLTVIAKDGAGQSATTNVTLSVTNPPHIAVILDNGSIWKYWDAGIEPSNGDWRQFGYDDSAWTSGQAELGYGDTDANRPEITVTRKIDGTPGDPAAITNATQLFRHHFNVPNPSVYTNIGLNLMVDDGAIVYFNGAEVFRSPNLIDPVSFTTFATATMPDDGVLYTNVVVPVSSVQNGDNVVSVEVHQNSITSSDISFDLSIWGLKPVGATLTIFRPSPDSPETHVTWTGVGTLQFNVDLGDPSGWSDIDPSAYPANDYQFDSSATGPRLFFRLVQ